MGSLHAQHPSLWVDTTGETHYPTLNGDMTVDVAVIGGGITGLTAALLLKERGVNVAVIEAGRIASGTTGYTTGKITALHGLIYADLYRRIGEEAARVYAAANQAAVERVAAFVNARAIACDFSRQPAYTYTEDANRICDIEAEVETLQKVGLPAVYTEQTTLPFPVQAAVRLDNQAQFHPRRYCLALANAIGGHAYEMTRALDVSEPKTGACAVRTDSGTVRADHVIVATLLPFIKEGGFYAKAAPSRTYLLGVHLDGPPLEGMYLSADEPARTIRHAGDGQHTLIGGGRHPVGQDADTARHYRELETWARARFPVAQIDYRWSAQDYMPQDRIPFVGRATPQHARVLVATGLQKWGLSNGTAAAMMLADAVLGRPNEWLTVFDATRSGYTPFPGDLVGKAYETGKKPVSIQELAPGEGAVFEFGDAKVATYRGEDGALRAVTAICTHMGCAVSFNTAERTWDCPCHGSRYHTDGRVIDGPAVLDLEKKDVRSFRPGQTFERE